jgi:small subunit ribosomal protein S5
MEQRQQRKGRDQQQQQPRTGDPDLKERLVGINRVAKTTKGGRTFSFGSIMVVGDEKGRVGHGFPLVGSTIPHEQEMRYAGAHILIRPASAGTGVIAGGAMRAVLESAGIKDVLAKSLGSSNPHNVVKATFNALKALRSADEVARMRGVSVSKVFPG